MSHLTMESVAGAYRIPTGERVSIIVPVRNEERKIGLLLEAILSQSAYFDEVIVTDGASSDRTREIMDRFRRADRRITVVVKPGSLSGEGRNHSIRRSTGDILVFLDAGMVPDRRWLERLLTSFGADRQIEFVFGRIFFDTAADDLPQTSFQRIAGSLGYQGPETWVKTLPSSGLRRRLWDRWGELPEALVGEDLLLFKKLEREKVHCGQSGEAHVRYFDFPENVREVWRKWFVRVKVLTQLPGMRADVVRRLGREGTPVVALVPLTYLSLSDPTWGFVIIALLLGRAFARVRRHRQFFRTFVRRPHFWVTAVLVLLTIDCARIAGLVVGYGGRLRHWWSSSSRPVRR